MMNQSPYAPEEELPKIIVPPRHEIYPNDKPLQNSTIFLNSIYIASILVDQWNLNETSTNEGQTTRQNLVPSISINYYLYLLLCSSIYALVFTRFLLVFKLKSISSISLPISFIDPIYSNLSFSSFNFNFNEIVGNRSKKRLEEEIEVNGSIYQQIEANRRQ